MKINVKEKIYSLGELLIAISIILNFRTMWTTLDSTYTQIIVFYKIGVIVGALICISFKKKGLKKQRLTNALLSGSILLIYLMLFLFINNDNYIAYLNFIFAFFFLFIYVKVCFDEDNGKDFFKLLTNIVVIICIVSLFFWIFGSILGVIKPSGYVLSNWTGQENVYKSVISYYGLHYEPQKITLGFVQLPIARNTGIFAEAPMAAFIYSVALLYEVFVENKKIGFKVLVIILAIISTASTAGIILLVLTLTIRGFVLKSQKQTWNKIKLIIAPVILIMAVMFCYSFIEQKLLTASGGTRIDDLVAGLKAWNNDIVFGNGFLNEEKLVNNMSLWRINNQGYSNSILYVLSQGGLYLGIVYFWAFMSEITWAIKHKKENIIYFVILYLLLFSITICPYQYLTIFILSVFIKSNRSLTNKKYIYNSLL